MPLIIKSSKILPKSIFLIRSVEYFYEIKFLTIIIEIGYKIDKNHFKFK